MSTYVVDMAVNVLKHIFFFWQFSFRGHPSTSLLSIFLRFVFSPDYIPTTFKFFLTASINLLFSFRFLLLGVSISIILLPMLFSFLRTSPHHFILAFFTLSFISPNTCCFWYVFVFYFVYPKTSIEKSSIFNFSYFQLCFLLFSQ